MTDNQQEPDSIDEQAGIEPPKNDSAKSNARKDKKDKKPKTGLLWLFVLITLAVSGAAGYGVYWLWQQTDQTSLSQAGLLDQSQTAIIDLREDLGTLESALDNEANQRSSAQDAVRGEFDLLKKSIDKQARHIKELSSSNRDQWLLAEVEYLLRLANQRILMSKDASGAMAMLDSADRILHGIDDVSLHRVRKSIADDLASLRSLEPIDVDGTYLTLSALAEQVEALELYDIPEFEMPTMETEGITADDQKTLSERMQEAASAIGGALSKAFIIREDNEQVEAMLGPQDELYLRQNLRLMLEQAQLALLSRKPAIYENSLQKAQGWIAQYFLIEKGATQSALETLSTLATLDVDPPLPDISGSFRALKSYQKGQMNARPGLDYAPAEQTAAEPVPDPAPQPEKEPQPEQEPQPEAEPVTEPAPAPTAGEQPAQEAEAPATDAASEQAPTEQTTGEQTPAEPSEPAAEEAAAAAATEA